MPEEQSYSQQLVQTILDSIAKDPDPRMEDSRALLARRVASSAALAPTRLPAPKNITEVAGYYNLLEAAGQDEMRLEAIAAALGVAGPIADVVSMTGPVRFFTVADNSRTTAAAQQQAPPTISVRDDFSGALGVAVSTLERLGCELPLLMPEPGLPGLADPVPQDLLASIGRSLELTPGLALRNPTSDSFVLARQGGEPFRVFARQVDANAGDAGSVATETWDTLACDAVTCTMESHDLGLVEVGSILAIAGWFPDALIEPTNIGEPGNWPVFINVTGLVAGRTTYGDELRRLYRADQLTQSSLRSRVDWVWNGTTFAP